MRAPTDIDELDRMMVDADYRRDHLGLAERLTAMAAQMPQGPGSMRAELLVGASEQYQLGGEPERGVECARAAVADGGDVRHSAQCHLGAALYATGDAEGARAALAEARRNRPVDPQTHLFAGEQCEKHGDPAEALRWYTRGLALAKNEDLDADEAFPVGLLLIARARVRRAMGLPGDDWDAHAAPITALILAALTDAIPAPRQRPGRGGCHCGSGRRQRRCCGPVPAYDYAAVAMTEEEDTTYVDLISK